MDHRQPERETVDELLHLLADAQCRGTVTYLRDAESDGVALEALSRGLAERGGPEPSRIATRLRHSVLPQLAAVGALTYDRDANTVTYHGHAALEELLDGVQPAVQQIESGNDRR